MLATCRSSGAMLRRNTLACVPLAIRCLTSKNFQRTFTTASRLPCKFRAGNAFPWLSRIWRGPAPSKVFRPTAASWSGTMSTDSSGSSSASDDQTQPDDGGDRQQSSDGSDDSTAPPKVQVTVNSGSPNRAAMQRYRKKYYHRPYTPGDLRTAAQNDTPVYFRVLAEQPATQAGTWQDVYVNTTTLQWLYRPPIPLIAPQNPEHMNLSTVLVLYHPETTQLHMNTSPLNIHGSDYYMFTSYVMPEAQLHISDGPDETGDYPVTFKLTPNPSAIFYDYNSFTKRYALYEVRHGQTGFDRIYLKPFYFPEEDPHQRIIKGVAMSSTASIPESMFSFMAYGADVHLYITNLPTV